MSAVFVEAPFTPGTVINGANDYKLINPNAGTVSRWLVHFVNDSSFLGSVTIKGAMAGFGLTAVAIPYTQLYINGAVGDGTQVSTAITTTSVIEVVADGMDVVFSVTSFTSGSGTLYVKPLQG